MIYTRCSKATCSSVHMHGKHVSWNYWRCSLLIDDNCRWTLYAPDDFSRTHERGTINSVSSALCRLKCSVLFTTPHVCYDRPHMARRRWRRLEVWVDVDASMTVALAHPGALGQKSQKTSKRDFWSAEVVNSRQVHRTADTYMYCCV